MGTYGLDAQEIADVFEQVEFESHCEGDFDEETFIDGAKEYIDRLNERGAGIPSPRFTKKEIHLLELRVKWLEKNPQEAKRPLTVQTEIDILEKIIDQHSKPASMLDD